MKVQLVYLVRNMRTKEIKSFVAPVIINWNSVKSLLTFSSFDEAEAYRLSLDDSDECETIERSI